MDNTLTVHNHKLIVIPRRKTSNEKKDARKDALKKIRKEGRKSQKVQTQD